jgi:hypothetical protein
MELTIHNTAAIELTPVYPSEELGLCHRTIVVTRDAPSNERLVLHLVSDRDDKLGMSEEYLDTPMYCDRPRAEVVEMLDKLNRHEEAYRDEWAHADAMRMDAYTKALRWVLGGKTPLV